MYILMCLLISAEVMRIQRVIRMGQRLLEILVKALILIGLLVLVPLIMFIVMLLGLISLLMIVAIIEHPIYLAAAILGLTVLFVLSHLVRRLMRRRGGVHDATLV